MTLVFLCPVLSYWLFYYSTLQRFNYSSWVPPQQSMVLHCFVKAATQERGMTYRAKPPGDSYFFFLILALLTSILRVKFSSGSPANGLKSVCAKTRTAGRQKGTPKNQNAYQYLPPAIFRARPGMVVLSNVSIGQ
jgi:hypothetical protein